MSRVSKAVSNFRSMQAALDSAERALGRASEKMRHVDAVRDSVRCMASVEPVVERPAPSGRGAR